MADPLMTLAQYTARLGRSLSGAKADQATAFLDDASALVRLIAKGELDDVAHDTDPATPAELLPVLNSMVTRARENPRGLTSEQIGDYRWASEGQPIYTTDAEERIILRAAGIGTVREIDLEGDMPQRLLDNAAAVPINLGGT